MLHQPKFKLTTSQASHTPQVSVKIALASLGGLEQPSRTFVPTKEWCGIAFLWRPPSSLSIPVDISQFARLFLLRQSQILYLWPTLPWFRGNETPPWRHDWARSSCTCHILLWTILSGSTYRSGDLRHWLPKPYWKDTVWPSLVLWLYKVTWAKPWRLSISLCTAVREEDRGESWYLPMVRVEDNDVSEIAVE